MRKIEREMQQAICNLSNGQTWRKANTEVAKNSEGDTSFTYTAIASHSLQHLVISHYHHVVGTQ